MNFSKIADSIVQSLVKELHQSGVDDMDAMAKAIINNSVNIIEKQAKELNQTMNQSKNDLQVSQLQFRSVVKTDKITKTPQNDSKVKIITEKSSRNSSQETTESKSSSPSQSSSPKQADLKLSKGELANSCPPPTKPAQQFQGSGNYASRFSAQESADQPQNRFGQRQQTSRSSSTFKTQQHQQNDERPPRIDVPSAKFGMMKEKCGDSYRQQKHARKTGTFTFGKIEDARRPSIFDDE